VSKFERVLFPFHRLRFLGDFSQFLTPPSFFFPLRRPVWYPLRPGLTNDRWRSTHPFPPPFFSGDLKVKLRPGPSSPKLESGSQGKSPMGHLTTPPFPPPRSRKSPSIPWCPDRELREKVKSIERSPTFLRFDFPLHKLTGELDQYRVPSSEGIREWSSNQIFSGRFDPLHLLPYYSVTPAPIVLLSGANSWL